MSRRSPQYPSDQQSADNGDQEDTAEPPPKLLPKVPLQLADWLTRELEPPDFICGRWLTTTSRVLVDAETGIGKTLWGFGLAMGTAAGRGFLHWQGVRQCRVLYIDGEMARRVTKQRLVDEVRRLGVAPTGMHIVSHEDFDNFHSLNTELGQGQIERVLKLMGGADLIVFDNIMCLIKGDQKDEEGWQLVMPWVRSLTRRHVAQVWLHHTGHDTSRSYGTRPANGKWIIICISTRSTTLTPMSVSS